MPLGIFPCCYHPPYFLVDVVLTVVLAVVFGLVLQDVDVLRVDFWVDEAIFEVDLAVEEGLGVLFVEGFEGGVVLQEVEVRFWVELEHGVFVVVVFGQW
jgi:hypothetical protein